MTSSLERRLRYVSRVAEISSLLTVLSRFHFNIYLVHCTRLLARGRPSPELSPLHTTREWLFEVFLAFEDSELWA